MQADRSGDESVLAAAVGMILISEQPHAGMSDLLRRSMTVEHKIEQALPLIGGEIDLKFRNFDFAIHGDDSNETTPTESSDY